MADTFSVVHGLIREGISGGVDELIGDAVTTFIRGSAA
jgi:hypothetical protein